MSDLAFHWIVVIFLGISNFQTFLIFLALTVISKNTEWGRSVTATEYRDYGGMTNDTGNKGT